MTEILETETQKLKKKLEKALADALVLKAEEIKLANEIDNKKTRLVKTKVKAIELKELKVRTEGLKEDLIKRYNELQKERVEHNAKVEEYNKLVATYNTLSDIISKIDSFAAGVAAVENAAKVIPAAANTVPAAAQEKQSVAEMSAAERAQLCNGEGSPLHKMLTQAYEILSTENKVNASVLALDDIKAYSDPGRKFHGPQHILQVVSPEIQEMIRKGGTDKSTEEQAVELTEEQAVELYTVAKHDKSYHVDIASKGFPFSVANMKDGVEETHKKDKDAKTPLYDEKGMVPYKKVKDILFVGEEIEPADLKIVETMFGFDEKTPVNFKGPALNEFLSACDAIVVGRAQGFSDKTILQSLISIQMTVPFENSHLYPNDANKCHATDLFENAKKFGINVTDEELLEMVNTGVAISNRDIGNFHTKFGWQGHEGDLLMYIEMKKLDKFQTSRIGFDKDGNKQKINDFVGAYSDLDFPQAMAARLNGGTLPSWLGGAKVPGNQLIQPPMKLENGVAKVDLDDPTYKEQKARAIELLVVRVLVKLAMVTALTGKTPQMPEDLKKIVTSELNNKPSHYIELVGKDFVASLTNKIFDKQISNEVGDAFELINNGIKFNSLLDNAGVKLGKDAKEAVLAGQKKEPTAAQKQQQALAAEASEVVQKRNESKENTTNGNNTDTTSTPIIGKYTNRISVKHNQISSNTPG